MKRDLRRIASMLSALALAVGMAASPIGQASAEADSGMTISGNVVGAAGNLGGISINGCTTDWTFCSDAFVTDDSGDFIMTGLQSGAYILQFQTGPAYQWGYYAGPGLTQDFGSATPVNAGSVLTDVQLAVAFSISGSLTGAAGALGTLQVRACSTASGCVDGTVDDSGNYSVTGLSSGTYNLMIIATVGIGPMNIDPHSPYESGYYDGSGLSPKSAAAIPIVVNDQSVTLPVFNVPVGAVLRGAFTGSAGNIGNMYVEVCSLKYGPCLTTVTADDGSFYVSGLWPDAYRVFIQDWTNTYARGYYTPSGLVQSDYTWTPVIVGAKDVTLPTLALVPASTIQGTVTGSAGNLGGIGVLACPNAVMGNCYWAQTDDSGSFTVTGLPTGSYALSFSDWTGTYAAGYYSDSGVTVPTADQATLVAVPPSASDLTVALTSGNYAFAPLAPTNVTATAGDGSATVSWTPSYDEGSAITGFVVTASDGSTCVSTTTSCTVTGLINGTAYTFQVAATNAIGTGSSSDPTQPVTPVGPAPNGPVKLVLSATTHTTLAGANLSVTVSALNRNGTVNTGYSRTVHFTSTDLRAGIPDQYTFTPADAGSHTFTVTLAMAGAQSISVSDGTLNRKLAISVKPGPEASLFVTGPETATAGVAGHYEVMAVDALGNIVTTDASSLSIMSTDPSMSVAPTPVALANGKHAFSATFRTSGVQSIQVVDMGNPSIVATFGNITVSPGKAASISLTGLANSTTAGVTSTVTATVHDRFGNVATGYVGTVHFISNDKSALLPADYTFTAADAGSHSFALTLATLGPRWVTIRDTVKHSIGGKDLTTVVAALP
jgi:hypothetical protein